MCKCIGKPRAINVFLSRSPPRMYATGGGGGLRYIRRRIIIRRNGDISAFTRECVNSRFTGFEHGSCARRAAGQIAISTDSTIRHQLAAARDISACGRAKFSSSSRHRIMPSDLSRLIIPACASHPRVKRLVASDAPRDLSRVTLPIIRSQKIKYYTRPDPFEVTLFAIPLFAAWEWKKKTSARITKEYTRTRASPRIQSRVQPFHPFFSIFYFFFFF